MTNKEIAQILYNVSAAYTVLDEKKYRFQILAYQKAAEALEQSTTQAIDLLKENKLEDLAGIGPSIRSHIEELLTQNKVDRFESIFSKVPKAMFPLIQIPSFGPKKAFKLVSYFHLENPDTVISDIEDFAKQGKIRALDGFGEKSEQDIIRAISEFRLGKGKTTRMALPYAFELAEKIIQYLKTSPEVIDAIPLGSLRRMKSTIGDIDIAVSTYQPQKVIDHFVKYPYIDRVIEKGDISSSLLTSSGVQVDILTQPPEAIGALIQHFTGSKNHNVALREYAQKKSLSLSEKGIKFFKDGTEELRQYATEEAFYHALSMDWIPPELRENTGEIEKAIHHTLPQLVTLKDIKGDLHIHSNYPIEPSHDLGNSSMQSMLDKAAELEYEYLGFSEHNPSVSKHNKSEIYTIISRRNEFIEQIKKDNKNVRVIKLLETDILTNGDIAIDDNSLSLLDATLVSIHSSFSQSKSEMTKRIITGLSHKKAKILSHPIGRMLNVRAGYELDYETLFDFCVKNNKALEINSWPERLDLPDSLVREAIKYHVKFVINTDSHDVAHMNLMKFGVSVAKRGWAEKSDILNTLSYNKFIEWLHS